MKAGDRILEVGCGWGGFALQAARDRGAHVTAITVSRAQFDEASRRVQAAGVFEKVNVRLCDYRDLDGEWDHAVSVEMIEAGARNTGTPISNAYHHVKSGGVFALQAIVIENERFEAYAAAPISFRNTFSRAVRCLVPTRCATGRLQRLQWTSAPDTASIMLTPWRTGAIGSKITRKGGGAASTNDFDAAGRFISRIARAFRAGNIDALQPGSR